jgi:hypothetical protein
MHMHMQQHMQAGRAAAERYRFIRMKGWIGRASLVKRFF